MTDTPSDVSDRLTALFMQRSPGDRVVMACEMFDLARALIAANIRTQNPGITDTELRVKIFERMYGSDLDPSARARVVARLRAPG